MEDKAEKEASKLAGGSRSSAAFLVLCGQSHDDGCKRMNKMMEVPCHPLHCRMESNPVRMKMKDTRVKRIKKHSKKNRGASLVSSCEWLL